MKKLSSILLCLALLVTLVAVPVSAATPTTALGEHYNFTFGADGDRYAYTANATETFKNNEFTPFYCWSSNTTFGAASVTYPTIQTDAGAKGVMRVTSAGESMLVLMNKDGKPYEFRPGKTYTVRIQAYNPVACNWSQYMICAGAPNFVMQKSMMDSQYINVGYSNTTKLTGMSNASQTNLIVHDGFSGGQRVALIPDNLTNYAASATFTGQTSDKNDVVTSGEVQVSRIDYNAIAKVKMPSNEDFPNAGINGGDICRYDSVNDSYFYDLPYYAAKTSTEPLGSYEYNNYMYLRICGGTTSAFSENQPFTLDIVSIDISSEDYVPPVETVKVDYVVGDTVAHSDTVAKNTQVNVSFAAKNTQSKYFAGWYKNDAYTGDPVTSVIAEDNVRLYAKMLPYSANVTVTYNHTDLNNTIYYPHIGQYTDTLGKMDSLYYTQAPSHGWSGTSFGTEYSQTYDVNSWGAGTVYMARNEDNSLFQAQENRSYRITYTYQIAGVSSKGMTVWTGYGFDRKVPGQYEDTSCAKGLAIQENRLGLINTTTPDGEWQQDSVVVTTGTFAEGVTPCIGLSVHTGGFDKDPDTAEITAKNIFRLKEMKIERLCDISFVEKETGETFSVSVEYGHKADVNSIEAMDDVIYHDGTGYTPTDITVYSDSDCTIPVDKDNIIATGDCTYYCVISKLMDNTNDQVSYYGFENLDAKIDKFKLGGFSIPQESGCMSKQGIMTTAATTGTVINPDVPLADGVTYSVGFFYKCATQAKVVLGGNELTLSAAADWTLYRATATAENYYITVSVPEAPASALCLDNFGVYTVDVASGVSVLTESAEEEADGQAMRVYYRYHSDDGQNIKIGGDSYTVTERGILLILENRLGNNELTKETPNAFKSSKTENFGNIWDYADGSITYSAYITGFDHLDNRNIVTRGYLVLDDGSTYYSEVSSFNVTDVKASNALRAKPQTYRFTDDSFLSKVHFDERYDLTSRGVTYDWTGATLRFNAKCVGDVSLKLAYNPVNINDDMYLTVYLDGVRLPKRYMLPITTIDEDEQILTFNVGNSPKEHTIEICRQNEASRGIAELLELSFNGELGTAENRDTLIEFIGDSITSGFGDLTSVARTEGDGSAYSDGTGAWAFQTARNLGVDYRITSTSGMGVYYSSGGTHGQTSCWIGRYDYENTARNSSTPYTCDREADIVCLYLGTNDTYARYLNLVDFTDAQLTEWMNELIDIVHTYNPGAKIVWLTSSTECRFQQSASDTINGRGGEANGYYLFSFQSEMQGGGGWHPNKEQQLDMGRQFTEFMEQKGLN